MKRKGDNRVKSDVDDLFALVNIADQELLLGELPRFVAEDLSRVLSTKPEDLDLFVLDKKSATTEDKVNALTAMVTAGAARDDKLNAVALKIAVLEDMIASLISKIDASSSDLQGTATSKTDVSPPKGQGTATSGGGVVPKILSEVPVNKHESVCVPNNVTQKPSFAEVAGQLSTDGGTFTTVKSKRNRPQKITVGSRKDSSAKIGAAKPVLFKSIFHVDNISREYGPGDLVDHLKSVDIPAVSVLESKSWRKSGPGGDVFKAFRLCVERQHADRIMAKDTWPKGILVLPWKFKSAATAATGTKLTSNDVSIEEVKNTTIKS